MDNIKFNLSIIVGTCVLMFIGVGFGFWAGYNLGQLQSHIPITRFDDLNDTAELKATSTPEAVKVADNLNISPQTVLEVELPLVEDEIIDPAFYNPVEVGGIIVKATYYSRAGCINCHPQLIMANGKPLDDNAYNVAYDTVPLGTIVTLCNMAETLCIDCEVTDRMGNHNPNRIDLTEKLFESFAPLSLGVIDRLILYIDSEE